MKGQRVDAEKHKRDLEKMVLEAKQKSLQQDSGIEEDEANNDGEDGVELAGEEVGRSEEGG